MHTKIIVKEVFWCKLTDKPPPQASQRKQNFLLLTRTCMLWPFWNVIHNIANLWVNSWWWHQEFTHKFAMEWATHPFIILFLDTMNISWPHYILWETIPVCQWFHWEAELFCVGCTFRQPQFYLEATRETHQGDQNSRQPPRDGIIYTLIFGKIYLNLFHNASKCAKKKGSPHKIICWWYSKNNYTFQPFLITWHL